MIMCPCESACAIATMIRKGRAGLHARRNICQSKLRHYPILGSVLICLSRTFQRLSRKPLPSPGNLLPSERLRFSLSMPSEQADANAVLSLNAQANKFHWHWFAEYQSARCWVTSVQVKVAVRSDITGKANRIPRWNREQIGRASCRER